MFYCSDFKLQELIDVQPKENSSYIRSLTEPFDEEMKLKQVQIKIGFYVDTLDFTSLVILYTGNAVLLPLPVDHSIPDNSFI